MRRVEAVELLVMKGYEVGGVGLALRTVQKRQGWGLGGAVLGTVGRVEAQLQ